MTHDEDKQICNEVRDMIEQCGYDPEECEDIFMGEIGLEPDYLPAFLLS